MSTLAKACYKGFSQPTQACEAGHVIPFTTEDTEAQRFRNKSKVIR